MSSSDHFDLNPAKCYKNYGNALRGISHKILQAQEEERKRISRELHDVIAQTLVGINLHVAALSKGDAGNPVEFQKKIDRTRQLVEQSVDTVHQFARELRPTVLDDLGLIPALQACMGSFMEKTGVHGGLETFAEVEQCPEQVRTVIYRVVQEALTNIARHAGATRVDVSIQDRDGALSLLVQDNGTGFDTSASPDFRISQRLGLLGMRERVEMIGGNFKISSAPGQPTTVRADFPRPPMAEKKQRIVKPGRGKLS